MSSTVLLIGRHTRTLASLAERLARRGHTVMLAWNSRDGLRLALEEHPDLVVLDQSDVSNELQGTGKVLRLNGEQRSATAAAVVERALGA